MAVNGRPHDPSTPEPAGPQATAEEQQRAADLVRLGAEQMRATPAPGWFDVAARVTQAVRSATRRGVEIDAAWQVVDPFEPSSSPTATPTAVPAEPSGDRLRISDLVLVDALRRALAAVPRCQPSAVDLLLDEDTAADGTRVVRCSGAHVSLVAAFDVDLHAVAGQARSITLETLTDLLGPPPDGLSRDAVVDVEIVDVTREDPRT
ncbi:hypothetical protein GCM10023258_38370 [Terrabacter aeriphilus]|uniref:Asp23/Gls24 family envelope stress response protein n=1 Tax=Terrabacter aeriphilus TaxID=515662 RepID=A0ABP9JLQ6_9MICO